MGETQTHPFQPSFNAALKVEFQGSRATSDGGLILVRELDERLGFSALTAQHLTGPRGKNTQFPLADLVRQSVYHRLAGNEEGRQAVKMTRLSGHRLRAKEIRLWLSVIACNLGNLRRLVALPGPAE